MLVLALALTWEIAMAKPPEPLEEIFPHTAVIIDAVVASVVSEDKPKAPDAPDVPRQVVTLEVNRVVRGALPPSKGPKAAKITVDVVKPISAYKLRVGVKGAWLLAHDAKSGELTVLGRYGPDSWTFEKIDAKLAELKPANLR
jgi:hypothetical protein